MLRLRLVAHNGSQVFSVFCWICLVLLSCLFWACSISTAPATIEAGKEFSWADLADVKQGMEQNEVRRLLGEPLGTSNGSDGTRWRYYYRVRQYDVVRVLGILPYRNTFSYWEREAEILFKNGRVEEIEREERSLLQKGSGV